MVEPGDGKGIGHIVFAIERNFKTQNTQAKNPRKCTPSQNDNNSSASGQRGRKTQRDLM